jgi:outer membrane protein TolC
MFGLLALLATAPQLGAEDAIVLDLKAAVDRARASHPQIREARAELSLSEAERAVAWSRLVPRLDLNGTYARVNEREPAEVSVPMMGTVELGDSMADSTSLGVEISQPVFTGGRIRAGIAATSAGRDAAKEGLEAAMRALALETARAFWRLVEARERLDVLDERIRQNTARLRDTRNRLEQGLVTRNEVLEVEMQQAELEAARAQASDGIEAHEDRLRFFTGIPLEQEVEPEYTFDTSYPEGGAPAPRATPEAVPDRPRVRAAEHAVVAARHGVTAERAGLFPELFLTGSYTYARPNPEVFPPEDEFDRSWRIGVSGRIALGGVPGTLASVDGAQAELERALAQRSQTRERSLLELRAATRSYHTAGEKVEAARAVLLRAEENERTVRNRVDTGVAVTADLLDAQALRVEAEMRLTEARVEREIAAAELNYALGREVAE